MSQHKAWSLLAVGLLFAAALPPAEASADCRPVLRDAAAADALISITVGHLGIDCDSLLNRPPLLTAAWSDPAAGFAIEGFNLFVTYFDEDGELPASISAMIDDRLPLSMAPVNAADTDPRDGIVYRGRIRSSSYASLDLPPGTRTTTFTASDGLATTSLSLEGPHVVDFYSATVRLPNPTNRLLIHPIANGPTLVPPAEVLPPLAQLPGSPANGVYSYSFRLDPFFRHGDSRFAVGEAFAFTLPGGSLEAEGFQLSGDASLTSDSYAGARAARLVDGPGEGLVLVDAKPDYSFSQLGSLHAWLRGSGAPDAIVEFRVLVSLDLDGSPDACVTASVAPPGSDWAESSITPSSPMELRVPDCDAAPRQQATLAEFQSNPTVGFADIIAAGIQAESAGPFARLDVDGLGVTTRIPPVNVDFDACFYRAGPGEGLESFQPISCVSDIGPNPGIVPAGAEIVNVWTDVMVPNGAFSIPPGAAIDPSSFGFYVYKPGTPANPVLPSPAAPGGLLRAVEDANGNGAPDDGEPVAFERALTVSGRPLTVEAPFDVSSRPDGRYPLLFLYSDFTGSASASLTLERFVNDVPTASLAATRDLAARRVAFHLGAADLDDAQGAYASGRGGLASWSLDFGDGSEPATGALPVPTCLSHRYQARGAYHVVLSVADRAGAVAVAALDIEVPAEERSGC